MSNPFVNTTVRFFVCCCTNGLHGYPGRSPNSWPRIEPARSEAEQPVYARAMHHFVERTTSERVVPR